MAREDAVGEYPFSGAMTGLAPLNGGRAMLKHARTTIISILVASSLSLASPRSASADSKLPDPATAGFAEKLYRVDCSHSLANDESVWTPGQNVGRSIEFSSTCWLIKRGSQWVLWDTGVPDAVAAMPDGQPGENGAPTWKRPLVFFEHVDPQIAHNTWAIFRPGVPVTLEGLAYALLGMLVFLTLYHFLVRYPVSAGYRRWRKKKAPALAGAAG